VTHPSRRDYFRAYRVRRADERAYLLRAIGRSGGRCLMDSGPALAPIYFSVEDRDAALEGLIVYVFSAGHQIIRNRPTDEHRLQIKYGDITENWRRQDHRLGFDPMRVDLTLVVAIHVEAGLIIGLDPFAYDPLPMGIQVGFKAAEVEAAQQTGWHAWERPNRPGRRRDDPRTVEGFETMVAFTPDRFLDYVAFERQAQTMRLDPALRLAAAEAAASQRASIKIHDLERAFDLSALEVLEIVSERPRLGMAVRGGVAEYHLGRALSSDRNVVEVTPGKQEGPPDYRVRLATGRRLAVECKNASPKLYADGTPKVEVQKTRASRGDPLSRFYPVAAFDVLAACMYGPTKRWAFRYKRSSDLERHPDYQDRIAPMQRVDSSWSDTLLDSISD
jgi:hypothetical protein